MLVYKPPIENMLYQLTLDEEQINFRDSILDDEKLIIFANARAAICNLSKNYRGWIANHADDIPKNSLYCTG